MTFVRAFGLVAVCSITTSAFAEESAQNVAAFRQVLARAGADVRADEAVASDRYTGRYRSADGVVVYVVQEDGSLTIDLPANWGATESRLRADSAGLFVAEASTVVRFEMDAEGRVTGLVAYPPNGAAAITAVKEPLPRGVVTIHDVPKEQIRRGIVTIEDVPTSVTSIAAN
jgi:hypothetical protein